MAKGVWPEVRDRLTCLWRGWTANFDYGTRLQAYGRWTAMSTTACATSSSIAARCEGVARAASRPRSCSGSLACADHVAGEVVENRCYGGRPWPVRHVPIGRGGGAEGAVPENTEPDRRSATKTRSSLGRGNSTST